MDGTERSRDRGSYVSRAATAVPAGELTLPAGVAEPPLRTAPLSLSGAVVAVAAKSSGGFERLIGEGLLTAGVDRTSSILIVGVAEELGVFASTFAPLSGIVTVEGMRLEITKRAEELARTAVRAMPSNFAVQHCVSLGWRDPSMARVLVNRRCKGLIVDERELSRRQLRSVSTLSDRLGIALMRRGGEGAGALPIGAGRRAPSPRGT